MIAAVSLLNHNGDCPEFSFPLKKNDVRKQQELAGVGFFPHHLLASLVARTVLSVDGLSTEPFDRVWCRCIPDFFAVSPSPSLLRYGRGGRGFFLLGIRYFLVKFVTPLSESIFQKTICYLARVSDQILGNFKLFFQVSEGFCRQKWLSPVF